MDNRYEPFCNKCYSDRKFVQLLLKISFIHFYQLYVYRSTVSAYKNSKAVKKTRPCKVEVTDDYPYQNSIVASKRLVCAVQQTCKISIAVKDSKAIKQDYQVLV